MKYLVIFFELFFVLYSVSAQPYECNICGCTNCQIEDPSAVVNFEYKGAPMKRPCQQLQQEAEFPTKINRDYCHDTLWKLAYEICRCVNEDGDLLSDIPGKWSSILLKQSVNE